MKILQVVKGFPPAVGGSSHHAYMLSKELARLGNEVTVVTTTSMNNRDVRGFSTGRPFTLKSTCPELPGFEVFDYLKVFRFRPVFQFWVHMLNPSMLQYLIKNEDRFDIVHGHVYMGAEADMAAVASRLKGVPMVLTAHDMKTTVDSLLITALKGCYDKTLGKFTLNSCRKLFADTIENVKEYTALGVPRDKIVVMPLGIDYRIFENNDKSFTILEQLGNPDRIVLFVGRLIEYKGAQYIIMAIRDIVNEYPNTKFVFVGEDWGYKKQLLALAKRLGVSNFCVFTGRISPYEPESRRKLLELYATADVFVLPSQIEGFGLVTLESIASGTPVVLANMGGLKRILTNIGGYPIDMSKGVPSQISKYVKHVFGDSEIGKDIEKQKRIVKRRYSYDRIARDTLKVYENVIAHD